MSVWVCVWVFLILHLVFQPLGKVHLFISFILLYYHKLNMAHNRLGEFVQTRYSNFLPFTYKATQILHKYSNDSEKKAFWIFSLGVFTAKKRIFINREQRRFVTALLSGCGTGLSLSPSCPLPHLWRKKRQSDKGQKQPKVLLSILNIVAHPRHQGLKNGFLIWDVDVITGEQLNYLSGGE